jgi:RND family efflux transporter MFP subunit
VATVERKDYELKVQQAEAALGQARARLGLSPTSSDERIVEEETATVRQAKATLEEARANRDRSAKLVEQGVVPRAEFDRTDAAFKVALGRYQDGLEEIRNRQAILQQRVSELSLAKQQLEDTSIASPFDGVVQERKSSVGEYLAAGAPVLTVVKIDPLRFRGEVPEREAHSVKAGQTVRLTLEGDPATYTGRIVRLSPTLAEQNRVLMIEAEVRNNGKLRPGAFAKAEIVTSDSSMAVTVPAGSVTTFAGIEKVVVVQNGKAVERPVTTGRRAAEWTEILSGISVGESVIAEPGNIQSGQLVTVLN